MVKRSAFGLSIGAGELPIHCTDKPSLLIGLMVGGRPALALFSVSTGRTLTMSQWLCRYER